MTPLLARLPAAWRGPLLSLALTVTAVPAVAQTPPLAAPADPEDRSAVVDEVVVRSRIGPAMWKVQKGESTVVILGSVSPLPHQPPWATRRFEAQLDGAREVLLPPNGRMSALGKLSVAVTMSGLKQPAGRHLPEGLSAELRNRYLRTIGLFGMDPGRYRSWKPAAAGFLMLSDFREKAGLSNAKPGSTIERLAQAKGVPVRRIDAGSMVGLVNGAKRLPDAAQQRCLALALEEIDREADTARTTAAAWAVGDLESVRRDYPAPVLESCLLQMPSYRTLVSRGVDAASAELQAALGAPGKTIAVIDVNFLLRRDGVLDRLKAFGADVTSPSE